MKRFYKIVSVQKAGQGYQILLDGRPVKTAMKKELIAANEGIANALMQEWANIEEEIIPDNMPLTQILNTKIDRVANEREKMQELLFKYLDTDLLCYRTDHPPELLELQEAAWNPYLDWFEGKFGCALETTQSIAAIDQPDDAHEKVQNSIKALDDDHFTALQLITATCGSLVLGLASLDQKANADNVFAAMRVEENFKAKIYNEEFYGPDPAQAKKDEALKTDLEAALKYLSYL